MSALPPKADMVQHDRYVSLCAKTVRRLIKDQSEKWANAIGFADIKPGDWGSTSFLGRNDLGIAMIY